MKEFANPLDKIVVTEWQVDRNMRTGFIVLHLAGVATDRQGRLQSIVEAFELPASMAAQLAADVQTTIQQVPGGQSRH